jgi:branched-subunit amino acid ABC-type transport system permease component
MPSWSNVLQLSASGLVTGSGYALLGAGFALLYGVTRRFHFAYGLSYTIAAYAAAQAGSYWGATFWVAVLLGCLAAVVSGVLTERWLYRPLAARAPRDALLTVFVASLGLGIVGQNIIRLIWLDNPTQQITGAPIQAVQIGSVYLTVLNLQQVAVSWAIILGFALLLTFTRVGRQVRAVRVNPEMSLAVGIDPGRIALLVFALGSAAVGVAGVFAGAQTAVTPEMGFRPALFAFVVAFLAGPERSPLLVGLTGVLLGLVESLSGLWLSAQWSTLVVFGIVVVFAALRPLQGRVALRRAARAAG